VGGRGALLEELHVEGRPLGIKSRRSQRFDKKTWRRKTSLFHKEGRKGKRGPSRLRVRQTFALGASSRKEN